MRPSFNPNLINDPFSDPGLFIPFLFQKRALLFDLGDNSCLTPRDLLKISHVFVTHAHMDHFIGFDNLLRISLGRDKELHLFGPEGIIDQVAGKLRGYTWNLLDGYHYDFSIKVTEILPGESRTVFFSCEDRFNPDSGMTNKPFDGALLKEPAFSVKAKILDHRIPCLGLSLVEDYSVNIIKKELDDLGLTVGPWLNELKESIYEEVDLDSEFIVPQENVQEGRGETGFLLGDLKETIIRISQGQKVSYIADIIGSHENMEKAVDLAMNSDHLFIEAAFLESDQEMAKEKYHLTAGEAGTIAGLAKVKKYTLFHFSPRYSDRAGELVREAEEAYKEHL